jgi:hypothetical protein
MIIGLDTEEKINLEFLSEFNRDQFNSRINWVLKSSQYRTLTKTIPVIDTTSPVITWNDVLSGTTTGITSGVTTIYLIPSGETYTSTDLKEIFLSSIIDNMDGEINIYNSDVEMYVLNDLIPTTGITDVGIYNVTFSIKDYANNLNFSQKYVSIYTESSGIYTTGMWNDDGVWEDLIVLVV